MSQIALKVTCPILVTPLFKYERFVTRRKMDELSIHHCRHKYFNFFERSPKSPLAQSNSGLLSSSNCLMQGFHKLITDWPQDHYDLMTIISAVIDRLRDLPENPILLHALAELYSYDHHYDKALAIYLK